MEDINIISKARDLALQVHGKKITTTVGGLKRPQILHQQDVASLVWVSGGTDEEIVAAWLHDCIEDGDVTIEQIQDVFGDNISQIVQGLTDKEGLVTLGLPERKLKQAERLKSESSQVKRVKLADQISNINFLLMDPTNDMTSEEIANYIKGTFLLASVCKGISAVLDNLYESTYRKCVQKYNIT